MNWYLEERRFRILRNKTFDDAVVFEIPGEERVAVKIKAGLHEIFLSLWWDAGPEEAKIVIFGVAAERVEEQMRVLEVIPDLLFEEESDVVAELVGVARLEPRDIGVPHVGHSFSY